MNRELIKQALEQPGPTTMRALLEDDDTVFWVDWREEDAAIVEYCERILKTGSLVSEFEDAKNKAGFEMYFRYKDEYVRVPLVIGFEDRHIALCSLNEVLWPDYEVRYCIDSGGADTAAFLPVPTSEWQFLEQQYGDVVHQLFYKLTPKPNLFTDTLPPELSAFTRWDLRRKA